MLTDADILQRLSNVEDATVERKVASDLRDAIRTAVAFSNSLPIGDPGIIFYGVRDNGQPEGIADSGIESHLMKLSKELGNIYPAIFPQLLARKTSEGLNFVAVIVTGSPNRPHFAGQSYIRDGTKTVPASEDNFQAVIASRNSKTNEILKSLDKLIRADQVLDDMNARVMGNRVSTRYPVLLHCNQFFVTLRYSDQRTETLSYPLHRVAVSYDSGRDCLLLEISPPM
jgi:predicted HTH transcriptional regulator